MYITIGVNIVNAQKCMTIGDGGVWWEEPGSWWRMTDELETPSTSRRALQTGN